MHCNRLLPCPKILSKWRHWSLKTVGGGSENSSFTPTHPAESAHLSHSSRLQRQRRTTNKTRQILTHCLKNQSSISDFPCKNEHSFIHFSATCFFQVTPSSTHDKFRVRASTCLVLAGARCGCCCCCITKAHLLPFTWNLASEIEIMAQWEKLTIVSNGIFAQSWSTICLWKSASWRSSTGKRESF